VTKKEIIIGSPKSIYIIFDPTDGPHVFKTKEKAWRTWDKWREEAENDGYARIYDTFWEMFPPQEYILKEQ